LSGYQGVKDIDFEEASPTHENPTTTIEDSIMTIQESAATSEEPSTSPLEPATIPEVTFTAPEVTFAIPEEPSITLVAEIVEVDIDASAELALHHIENPPEVLMELEVSEEGPLLEEGWCLKLKTFIFKDDLDLMSILQLFQCTSLCRKTGHYYWTLLTRM